MKIQRNIQVPTGNILVVEGDHGSLECLSIADYGQIQNIKADFLGLTNEITKLKHCPLMPLTEKWVVTVSTQYGCSMNCVFCDVPKVGKGTNVSYNDLKGQIIAALELHPEITATKRLNVHYARMGEPTWNWSVINFTKNMLRELRPYIGRSIVHPVISTMMPKNNPCLNEFLSAWMELKNYDFRGQAGIQFSINSTNDDERAKMFSGNSLSLKEISAIAANLDFPVGRKITLNFAVADYEIDAVKLRRLFDPKKFMVKMTPMHKTRSCSEHDIATDGDYTTFVPYAEHEKALKDAGFDVLVFIASDEEDLGRITCGNAILSGTMPLCEYKEDNL